MTKLRVWALPDQPLVQYRTDDGELVRGRWIARDRTEPFDPLPDGELVAETVEVMKDIRRGHLTTTPPPSPNAMFRAQKDEA